MKKTEAVALLTSYGFRPVEIARTIYPEEWAEMQRLKGEERRRMYKRLVTRVLALGVKTANGKELRQVEVKTDPDEEPLIDYSGGVRDTSLEWSTDIVDFTPKGKRFLQYTRYGRGGSEEWARYVTALSILFEIHPC